MPRTERRLTATFPTDQVPPLTHIPGINPALQSLVVWQAAAIHGLWGVIFLFSGTEVYPTPTGPLIRLLGASGAGAVLIFTAVLAIGAAQQRSPWAVLGLIPQQALLLLSAFSAVSAVATGQYYDGVVRPSTFILVDQAPIIALAAVHLIRFWPLRGGR